MYVQMSHYIFHHNDMPLQFACIPPLYNRLMWPVSAVPIMQCMEAELPKPSKTVRMWRLQESTKMSTR